MVFMVGAGVGVGVGNRVGLKTRVLGFCCNSYEAVSVLFVVVSTVGLFLVPCLWLLISSWSLCGVSCKSSVRKRYAGIFLVIVVASEVIINFVVAISGVVIVSMIVSVVVSVVTESVAIIILITVIAAASTIL